MLEFVVQDTGIGAYANCPAGTATFYGMAYESDPIYADPPSNSWYGWQAWSMQRVAKLYAAPVMRGPRRF